MNIFYIHPLIQIIATVLGLYVLYLGRLRHRDRQTGRKPPRFPWGRHVRLGRWAVGLWLAGILAAVLIITLRRGTVDLAPHPIVGFLAIFLILFVFASGQKLTGKGLDPAARPKWAARHGTVALVLVVAAVLQCLGGLAILLL